MNKLLAVCLLAGTVLSCGSDSKSGENEGDPDPDGAGSGGADSGDEPDDPAAASTYEDVSSVAQMIYDAVEAGDRKSTRLNSSH